LRLKPATATCVLLLAHFPAAFRHDGVRTVICPPMPRGTRDVIRTTNERRHPQKR
jgi:hypothetical protein